MKSRGEDVLRDVPDLDVMAVVTPDHLHTEVTLAALRNGTHVVMEKPMCLSIEEADEIIELADAKGLVVCVDMHKRYDPDHLRVQHDLSTRIGDPLYGQAVLEEPLEVSTSTFKWAEQSDPFSYVGPHWTDLIYNYFRSKPVALSAVGQKKRLVREGIDAYDAVQVRVEFDNGMSIYFHNNWITPDDFEGPVNQGHEIVGTDGKVESDQQYRGLRFWYKRGRQPYGEQPYDARRQAPGWLGGVYRLRRGQHHGGAGRRLPHQIPRGDAGGRGRDLPYRGGRAELRLRSWTRPGACGI